MKGWTSIGAAAQVAVLPAGKIPQLPAVQDNSGKLELATAVSVSGNFINSGVLQLDYPSSLNVGGNFTQTATGNLRINLRDTPLTIAGSATLAGKLEVTASGPPINAGQTLNMIVFARHTGNFLSVAVPTWADPLTGRPLTAHVLVNDRAVTAYSDYTNHAPVLKTSPDFSGLPNQTLIVSQGQAVTVKLVGTDTDAAQTLTYSLTSTAPATRYRFDATSGVLMFDALAPGTYSFVASAKDNGQPAMSSSVPFRIAVNNVASRVQWAAAGSGVRGALATLSGSFTDPGGAAESPALTIDFGDGTRQSNVPIVKAGDTTWSFSVTHAYRANPGDYTVTASVADSYGGVGTATTTEAVIAPGVLLPIDALKTSFTIKFNTDLDAASATNLANYLITDASGRKVMLQKPVYNAAARSVTLRKVSGSFDYGTSVYYALKITGLNTAGGMSINYSSGKIYVR